MQKSSFIDYPDKISTVVFTAGCNFRCPYCHNSHLVYNTGEEISEKFIISYLEKRNKYINALCISGGEPTLHQGLYSFIKKIKEKGFLVKLDTNGTNYELLNTLLDEELLDYIAMDIKAPLDKYKDVVNVDLDIKPIYKSIDIIKNSDIDYEFRTTVCNELLTQQDLIDIGKMLSGSKRYAIQNFRDGDSVIIGKGVLTPFKDDIINEVKRSMGEYCDEIIIRK